MTDPTYPMTNAELAAAIEWAANRATCLTSASYTTATSKSREDNLFFDHLSELLRIQRERAALPVPKYSVVASGYIDPVTGEVTQHPPINVGRFGVQPE